MTADQILELVSFPLHLTIAEEGIDQALIKKHCSLPAIYDTEYWVLGFD